MTDSRREDAAGERDIDRALWDLRFYANRLTKDKPDRYEVTITAEGCDTRLSDSIRVVIAALSTAERARSDLEQDRSDVWRTLGIAQDADADAAIAAIVSLRVPSGGEEGRE